MYQSSVVPVHWFPRGPSQKFYDCQLTIQSENISLDEIRSLFCPNRMHGNFGGCFTPGKASSHSTAALPSFVILFLICSVFACFHTTGCEAYSFTTDGYGIVNVRTH